MYTYAYIAQLVQRRTVEFLSYPSVAGPIPACQSFLYNLLYNIFMKIHKTIDIIFDNKFNNV
jgi:hypothetical protein